MTRISEGRAPATAGGVVAGGSVLRWAPLTSYIFGQQIISPNNDVVKVLTAHTSTGVYDPTKFGLSSTYARRNAKVLYPEAFGAVGDGVTDDTAAINAMVAAAIVLVDAGAGHVVMQFDAAEYLLAGPPLHPDGAGGAYAQIPLPKRSPAAARANLEFRGVASAPLVLSEEQTAIQKSGTVLRSTAAGGLDATYGLASVIGGPAWKSVGVGWSNLLVVQDGITIRRPDNPSIAGADFTYCLQAKTNNITLDTNVGSLAAITYPTQPTNIGLLMPEVGNNAVSTCDGETYIFGCYAAIRYSEHFTLNHLIAKKNRLAFAIAPSFHGSILTHANLEWHNFLLGEIDPAVGVIDAIGGLSYTAVTMLDIEEAAPGGDWSPVTHIRDANDQLMLEANYVRVVQNVGTVTGPLTRTGTGAGHRLRDLAWSEAWTDLELTPPWANSAIAGYANAAVRKLRDGEVQLRGAITGGASATTVFNLPSGFRPATNKAATCAAYPAGSTVFVDIGGTGQTTIFHTGSPTTICLDTLRFQAA